MRKRIIVIGASLLAALASIVVFVQPASAAVGLHISGRNIVEANDQQRKYDAALEAHKARQSGKSPGETSHETPQETLADPADALVP